VLALKCALTYIEIALTTNQNKRRFAPNPPTG
jgi:hypothetical protein